MTAWEELLIGAALLAVLAALVLAAWGRWRTRRVMLRLERMLEEAIRGTFTETSFDESLFSAVETQLAHYLAASAVSARNLQEEKNKIKSLIADISHQTKTPITCRRRAAPWSRPWRGRRRSSSPSLRPS